MPPWALQTVGVTSSKSVPLTLTLSPETGGEGTSYLTLTSPPKPGERGLVIPP